MVHKCKQDFDLYKKRFSPIGSKQQMVKEGVMATCSDEKFPTPRQKHDNLEHTKMLTIIFCKHAKHTTLREFIDP